MIMVRVLNTGNPPTHQGGLSRTIQAMKDETAALSQQLRKPKEQLPKDSAEPATTEQTNGPK